MSQHIPIPVIQDSFSKGSQICALLGATNTGKTYKAIERLLYYGSGIIGLPLRLLAREVYDQLVAKVGVNKVALFTGEERIEPIETCIWVATVESMPLQHRVPFLVVDEIQLASHPKRGHVFTDRILHARGTVETWFLGSDMMKSVLEHLVPTVQIYSFQRFSKLIYDGQKPLHRLPKRSAIIAFSIKNLYELAEEIRFLYGGVSVVLGSLSPKARNAQVQMFEKGEVDYIVSTDAIGMGLNLDVRAVYFSSLRKYDGQNYRDLHPWEIGQIAGRAGRYKRDGYFGTLEESSEKMRDWLVEQVEQQSFSSLSKIYYRNSDLRFDNVEELCVSLRRKASIPFLYPSWNLIDERSLHRLISQNHIQRTLTNSSQIELLWQVCNIPDYRQEADSNHVHLLEEVYWRLSEDGILENYWLEDRIQQLQRKDGTLPQILMRMSYLRTIAYIVHRDGWVQDADNWRSLILEIEEKLSSCLHQRLTQTFVDEKSSVRQRFEIPQNISNEGADIFSSKGKLGYITNWSFVVEPKAIQIFGSANARRSSRQIAEKLYQEFTNQQPKFFIQGYLICYFSQGIAQLSKGHTLLQPKISILAMDLLSDTQRRNLYQKAQEWFVDEKKVFFDAMLPPQKSDLLEQISVRLQQGLGIVPREDIQELWKKLSKKEKGILKRHRIILGRSHLIAKTAFKKRFMNLRIAMLGAFWEVSHIPDVPSSVLLKNIIPKKITSRLGYVHIHPNHIRMDIYERIINELRRDAESLQPCSWLGCKREEWERIRKEILKGQKKKQKSKYTKKRSKKKQSPKEIEQSSFSIAIGEISKMMGLDIADQSSSKSKKKNNGKRH